MKGIILAGGSGSRLRPLTLVTNKHLLPVYDKPMIWWPLVNLLKAGIDDIFIVTGGDHFSSIGALLGSGDKEDLEALGLDYEANISYGVQKRPAGIAHALGLAREFAGEDSVAVILGDNIFQDQEFLKKSVGDFKCQEGKGAHIFLKSVPEDRLFEESKDGRRAKYGIAALKGFKVSEIQEKPKEPATSMAVTGAYLYDAEVFEIVRTLKPSWRGELEITDVNNAYIQEGLMGHSLIQGEWTDAGSIETLKHAGDLAQKWHVGH